MPSKKNPKVDAFIQDADKWQKEFKKLRKMALDSGLDEDLKWGVPCYSYEGGNVLLIHGFKEYCAMLFVKGSLLKDPKGILVAQTGNVQAGRQARFTSADEIDEAQAALKNCIKEAVEVEKAGMKVNFKKTAEFSMPDEFKERLDKKPALKKAFESLTPGRQRAYLLFFSSAKQSQTRVSRIDKFEKKILDGKGMDD